MFVVGKDNITNCKLPTFTYHLVIVYHTTFVLMAIDKMIAIGYTFKYKTSRVATTMVCISWLLAVVMSLHILFTTSGQKVLEYSVCLITGIKFLGEILTYMHVIPETVITTLINIHFATKAYQVNRKIQN